MTSTEKACTSFESNDGILKKQDGYVMNRENDLIVFLNEQLMILFI